LLSGIHELYRGRGIIQDCSLLFFQRLYGDLSLEGGGKFSSSCFHGDRNHKVIKFLSYFLGHHRTNNRQHNADRHRQPDEWSLFRKTGY